MTDNRPTLSPTNRVSGKGEMFAPFGPLIAYQCLSENTVNGLNRICDDHVKGKRKLEDHSTALVGKVREELSISKEGVSLVMEEIQVLLDNYLKVCYARVTLGEVKSNIELKTMPGVNGWFVRQFAGDYNPIHEHTQCDFSCIGYLKIPNHLEQEWEREEKKLGQSSTNKSVTQGLTQFSSGNMSPFMLHTFCLKPKVGDFWLFPAQLQHMVWPFKGKGERRSFSMNIALDARKMNGSWAVGQEIIE